MKPFLGVRIGSRIRLTFQLRKLGIEPFPSIASKLTT